MVDEKMATVKGLLPPDEADKPWKKWANHICSLHRVLGIAKAKIAGQSYALSAGITLFNGLIAGAAAYGIG
ncbi:hypothetical protein HAX54_045406 [Datura stramonium]|uniref:Uncharacterized protein n=1 Tax=Datura stramonium TaxID=4076 RepID=A0ABS8SRP3_DATST|nr:hypothetical protein [Datura stramonium]